MPPAARCAGRDDDYYGAVRTYTRAHRYRWWTRRASRGEHVEAFVVSLVQERGRARGSRCGAAEHERGRRVDVRVGAAAGNGPAGRGAVSGGAVVDDRGRCAGGYARRADLAVWHRRDAVLVLVELKVVSGGIEERYRQQAAAYARAQGCRCVLAVLRKTQTALPVFQEFVAEPERSASSP